MSNQPTDPNDLTTGNPFIPKHRYERARFGLPAVSQTYRDNWERIFGKKEDDECQTPPRTEK